MSKEKIRGITKLLKIPFEEVEEIQKILNSKGDGTLNTIKTYTTKFGDNGEGNVEVDIKVCDGEGSPFIDAVIFQDGSEIACLDIRDKLVGEYIFETVLKNNYIVLVRQQEKVEEIETLKFICPQCGSNELGSIENVLTTYPIIEIPEDGNLNYGDSITHDSEILAYECMECGFQLQKNGITITDCMKVGKWVKRNCSQN